ncbi:SWIM zinc finger family protein [Planktothrix mougeotii]|uniref:SWIM zinc finger family protein n=1 Tax=Planktothrix mougeotii LEGE 06226 TaxID=1828728 RepID=A0ABR9UAB3_9CYAN|nr:SWIM zinc finger family protein [Planktothrix mougeotii]MBE9143126.1 SWIM zinc finger family protein [Planktothrix mougeotii LEGE 06226]
MVDYTMEANKEWWSQQWLDLLDKYRFKKRLERARNYARQGNVLNIDFKDQKVLAQVQGTQPEPYTVSLWLDVFSDEEWNYIIETLSQRAIFSAKLLAGEMPQDIEDVFAANGLRLFPFSLDNVHSECSCPDKANPCKHIGAVYYMLGDRFSEDPFVLFQLRGRTQEQIITTLRQLRGQSEEDINVSTRETTAIKSNPHAPKLNQFWNYSEQLDPALVVITPPPGSETVLDVLGTIPLAPLAVNSNNRSTSSATDIVMQYLETVYKNVSQQAVLIALNREEI